MPALLCVLNGFHRTPYGDAPVAGMPAYLLAASRARAAFPDTVLLAKPGESFPGLEDVPRLDVEGEDAFASFKVLLERFPAMEHFIFCDLFAPFVEPALGHKLSAMVDEEIAHYAYGEHFPRGVCPQVIAADCLATLRDVASGNNRPLDDEAIMDLMGIQINEYDIEVEVSPVDFRRWRLDLRCRTHEGATLCGKLARALGEVEARSLSGVEGNVAQDSTAASSPRQGSGTETSWTYDQLADFLVANPAAVRTVPAYVEIDLSENCDLACAFCPREVMGLSGKHDGAVMPVANALALCDAVAAANPAATIALSPYSEPLLHPEFRSVAQGIVDRGLRLLVETNGTRIDAGMADFLASLPEDRCIVIVSLDVLSADEYVKWKKVDAYARVIAGLELLFAKKAQNVYVQVLNMKELAETIDGFYDFWKAHESAVLPRKYNDFCGRLPDRRDTDLSPLLRFPCWHLGRDLVVRHDGAVHRCKQAVAGGAPLGNVFTDGLPAVWARLGADFAAHATAGEGDWAFAACRACDEWHTYNF